MMPSFASARFALVALTAALVLLPQALADDYVNRANALYNNIRQANRSDLMLLPAVARMEKPPAAVADPDKAMLLPANSSAWEAVRAWATSQPQQDVLEALSKAAHSESRLELKGFGQPYGADAVASGPEGIALIRAELYTELGDPPMLSGSRFLYLNGLEQVAVLVHVEATRRAADGDITGAIQIMTEWLLFARQIADREFYREARWGLRQMTAALERIRDIAYQDFRDQRAFKLEDVMNTLQGFQADHVDLRADRLSFPRADKIGADQVLALTFEPRRGPNPQFSATMARLSSHERPLRLFAEAAAWDQYAKIHADYFETKERLDKVYNDWASRWPLDSLDTRQTLKTDWENTPRNRFAMVFAVFDDMHNLLNDRQVVRAHVAGMRTSLGILGFFYRNGNFPPDVTSIRPTFIRTLDPDPFHRSRTRPPLEYFVPIRDQRFGPREEPRPHTLNVVTREGQYNFQVRLGSDQFILYSVGPDGQKDWATIISDEPAKDAMGDLLLWPPTLSLLRQRLIETRTLR
jgi:hypothetical protein